MCSQSVVLLNRSYIEPRELQPEPPALLQRSCHTALLANAHAALWSLAHGGSQHHEHAARHISADEHRIQHRHNNYNNTCSNRCTILCPSLILAPSHPQAQHLSLHRPHPPSHHSTPTPPNTAPRTIQPSPTNSHTSYPTAWSRKKKIHGLDPLTLPAATLMRHGILLPSTLVHWTLHRHRSHEEHSRLRIRLHAIKRTP